MAQQDSAQPDVEPAPRPARKRSKLADELRETARRNALRKRVLGVPTYSVPEAAALLSVSAEHLHRLVRAQAFPAVDMRLAGSQGRYVVPAKAVEQLLDDTTTAWTSIDVAEWSAGWNAERDNVTSKAARRAQSSAPARGE